MLPLISVKLIKSTYLQTSTGAVACQLLDALSPGSINIAKVIKGASMKLCFAATIEPVAAAIEISSIMPWTMCIPHRQHFSPLNRIYVCETPNLPFAAG